MNHRDSEFTRISSVQTFLDRVLRTKFPKHSLETMTVELESAEMQPELLQRWKQISHSEAQIEYIEETPSLRFSTSMNTRLDVRKQPRSKEWLANQTINMHPVEVDILDHPASSIIHSEVVNKKSSAEASNGKYFGSETATFPASFVDDSSSSSTYSTVYIKKLDIRLFEDLDIDDLESSEIEELSIYE